MNADIMFAAIRYFSGDHKRIEHRLNVYGYTQLLIARKPMPKEVEETLGIAAILHDIGIKEAEEKYNYSDAKLQQELGPVIAEKLMSECSVDQKIALRVQEIIANHHNYGALQGLDFAILVEADFIVNASESRMKKEAIEAFIKKYFVTDTGKSLVMQIFGI